ncbi:MAG: mechanosensitive ion channel [Lachnospiraceae bacterium]|nr:mechanosensitive ion channel [Lachnospiraceae bacterium]
MYKSMCILDKMHVLPEGLKEILPEETVPPIGDVESVEDVANWAEKFLEWMWKFCQETILPIGIKLIIALLIFLIGKKIIKHFVKVIKKSLEKANLEEGTSHFLCSFIRIVGMIVLIFIVAGYLNFSTGPIVAALGSAGLAVGLALQGSLANFAGGVLILLMKPFRVGDYICALGSEGVVTKIDIVYTTLCTSDNKSIVVPNGSLSNTEIVNVTKEPKRRVDLVVGIDYDEDIRRVKEILLKTASNHELVLKDENIQVFVHDFDSSAISMGVRVWTATENYWTVKWDLQEQIKIIFDENNVSIPYDRLDVQLLDDKKDK